MVRTKREAVRGYGRPSGGMLVPRSPVRDSRNAMERSSPPAVCLVGLVASLTLAGPDAAASSAPPAVAQGLMWAVWLGLGLALGLAAAFAGCWWVLRERVAPRRSEEHTSELQSREKLV